MDRPRPISNLFWSLVLTSNSGVKSTYFPIFVFQYHMFGLAPIPKVRQPATWQQWKCTLLVHWDTTQSGQVPFFLDPLSIPDFPECIWNNVNFELGSKFWKKVLKPGPGARPKADCINLARHWPWVMKGVPRIGGRRAYMLSILGTVHHVLKY